MINTVSSKIKNISTLQYKEKNLSIGPDSDEARKWWEVHAQKIKSHLKGSCSNPY